MGEAGVRTVAAVAGIVAGTFAGVAMYKAIMNTGTAKVIEKKEDIPVEEVLTSIEDLDDFTIVED